jgi:hypothetical protein
LSVPMRLILLSRAAKPDNDLSKKAPDYGAFL